MNVDNECLIKWKFCDLQIHLRVISILYTELAVYRRGRHDHNGWEMMQRQIYNWAKHTAALSVGCGVMLLETWHPKVVDCWVFDAINNKGQVSVNLPSNWGNKILQIFCCLLDFISTPSSWKSFENRSIWLFHTLLLHNLLCKWSARLHFLEIRLKTLRFAQEQRVSCNPMSIITCITSDATFPKQTPNKVILPPPKGTQRVSLEIRGEYADILYLNSSPRARFGEGLVLPTMEKNWSSHTKRRVEARESHVRSWRSRSSSTRRWRSRSEKNVVDQDGTGEVMEVHRQNSSSNFMMCIGFIKIVMNFGTYRM